MLGAIFTTVGMIMRTNAVQLLLSLSSLFIFSMPLSAQPQSAAVQTSLVNDLAYKNLAKRVAADPADYVSETALIKFELLKVRESGNLKQVPHFRERLDAILKDVPHYSPASSTLSSVLLTLHEFSTAKEIAIRELERAPQDPSLRTILFDAEFEIGDLTSAGNELLKLKKLSSNEPSTLVREARILTSKGDLLGAQKLLTRAATAASQDSRLSKIDTSWYYLTLGQYYFTRGQFPEAEKQYLKAEAAFPGWWAVDAHFGELLAAKRSFDEAVERFKKAASESERPESWQAIGEVLTLAGKANEASSWFKKAELGYQGAEAGGLLLFLHHQAHFYSDPQPNASKALALSERDAALRTTQSTLDQLAWANYRAGNFEMALEISKRALALQAPTAHVLYHASMIFGAAGKLKESKDFLALAGKYNPKFLEFHSHH